MSRPASERHVPERTCVGCRGRAPQADLVRFVRRDGAWTVDADRVRSPGRGAYLCSAACAQRALKNKRYPGLGAAATCVIWKSRRALFEREPGVYDSAGPRKLPSRNAGKPSPVLKQTDGRMAGART